MTLAGHRAAPHQTVAAGAPVSFFGWWILATCIIAVFTSSFGLTYTVSVYVDPMLDDLGISRTLYSLAYAVGTGAGGLALLLMGRRIERWGSRRVMVAGASLRSNNMPRPHLQDTPTGPRSTRRARCRP